MKSKIIAINKTFCISAITICLLVGFSLYSQNDVFAQKSKAKNGSRINRPAKLTAARAVTAVKVSSSAPTTEVIEAPPPPEQLVIVEEENVDDIMIPTSQSSNMGSLGQLNISKLQKERDRLKRELDQLKTESKIRNANPKSESMKFCFYKGTKQKLSELISGQEIRKSEKNSIEARISDQKRILEELETWIAENTEKRDELKGKYETARLAATGTQTAAAVAGVAAGAMAMQNSQLKTEANGGNGLGKMIGGSMVNGLSKGSGDKKSDTSSSGGGSTMDSLKGKAGDIIKDKAGGMLKDKAGDMLGNFLGNNDNQKPEAIDKTLEVASANFPKTKLEIADNTQNSEKKTFLTHQKEKFENA